MGMAAADAIGVTGNEGNFVGDSGSSPSMILCDLRIMVSNTLERSGLVNSDVFVVGWDAASIMV